MSPCACRVLGAATVSLEQLVANPGLPLSLSHVPLLDPQGQPTGVSSPLHPHSSTLGCHQARRGCHLSLCSAPSPSDAPMSPMARLGTSRSPCKDRCHRGRCHQGHPNAPTNPRRGGKRISRYGTHGRGVTGGDIPSVVATASPPVPQVRVRVIEGHQLQGNDIKPVVTVLIGQKRFRTRIQTGNNPYYNEVTPGR